MVNTTSSHNPHIQTVGNNVSAINQPAASNMSVLQDNILISSTGATLNASVIPYSNNQLANLDLWDSLFAPASLFGIDKF